MPSRRRVHAFARFGELQLTPLIYAIFCGVSMRIIIMLSCYCDINQTDVSGWSALHWAIFHYRDAVIFWAKKGLI